MRKNNKIAIFAAAAALSATVMLAPVNVQAKTGWKSKVLLPSSGVDYALSAKKVSVRDVENKMVRTGKMDKLVKSSSKAGTDNGNSGQTDVKKAVGASVVTAVKAELSQETDEDAKTAAQQYEEEVNAIIETTLTPVQEKEKAVVERAKLAKQADVVDTEEISEKEAIMAAVTAPTVTEDELNAPIQSKNDTASAASESTQTSNEASAESSTSSGEAEAAEASGESAQEEDTAADKEQGREAEEGTSKASETEEGAADAGSETAGEESSQGSSEALVVSTANDFVYIRKEPSTDSEIVGKMYAQSVGTVVEEEKDGWIKMKSGNVTGYVKADYLASGNYAKKLADAVGTNKAIVTTTTLRVRAASSTDSDVISLIGQGEELDIIGEENGFYKVSTSDGDGYISKDFADVETIYPDAISIEEEQAKIKAEEEKAAAAAAAKNGKKSSSSGSDKSSTQKTAAQSAAGSSKGQQVASYAQQFLGNPYVWGGSSLTNGTDCSGFTMAVYAHFGVSLPHYDGSQRSVGTAVSSLSEAQPGDLICYYGHVGIYIGNGQIVHASNPKSGITISNASYRQIAAIRRIFN